MAKADLENICSRFNSISWHDCKLVDIEISKNGLLHTSRFRIRLLTDARPGSYAWEDATLILMDCRLVKADLDLLGKQLCGGDISAAFCEAESELKATIETQLMEEFDLPQEEYPLANHLQFTISLIPPGGEITVFAKDFQIIR